MKNIPNQQEHCENILIIFIFNIDCYLLIYILYWLLLIDCLFLPIYNLGDACDVLIICDQPLITVSYSVK